nr:arsenate reductase (glutaredoxin) [Ruegeria arenilitoris]
MAVIAYWHNPRCSKSRTGLALLEENGAQVEVRKYLEDAPSADEIRAVLGRLGINAIDLMRTGEKRFKELGLTKNTPADDLITAMTENPILIERPLAISGDKAAIGRPPENLLALL